MCSSAPPTVGALTARCTQEPGCKPAAFTCWQHSSSKPTFQVHVRNTCPNRQPSVQDTAHAQQEKRLQDMRPLSWQGLAQEAFPCATAGGGSKGGRGLDDFLELAGKGAEGGARGGVDLPAGLHEAAPLRLTPVRHLRRHVTHHQTCHGHSESVCARHTPQLQQCCCCQYRE